MIAHIVLFSPKSEISQESLRAFATQMAGSFRSIASISRVAVGRRVEVDAGYKREFGDATYEYAAILEFTSRAGLIDYLRHPLHHELGRLFWETCERTVITEVELHDGRDKAVVDLLSGTSSH